jgi:hypothetical protein
MHSDAKVGQALNNTSIGRDLWKSGSANRRFRGSLISDRSMGWSGIANSIGRRLSLPEAKLAVV